MPLQDHLLVNRPPGGVVLRTGGGGGRENGERQLCNWLTLEGLAQVQIVQALCCKHQTFVSPQVECFFQTLSLLHIWVQFSACPHSENQFLLPSSALLFSSSFEHRPGRGDYTVPPQIQARQQMVLINWHPPPPNRLRHPRRRGRKTGQATSARMCFWAPSANCGNSFHT